MATGMISGARQWPPAPTQTQQPPAAAGLMSDLNTLVPGYSNLLGTASGNIQNLLTGVESPAITQTMNAYWGAGSGLGPGSEFLNNRAIDLFGIRGQQRQNQGLDALNALTGSISGPLASYRGQDIQRELGQGNLALGQSELSQRGTQFTQGLREQQRQFDLQHALNQAQQDLQRYLGTGNLNLQTLNSYLNFLQ